MIERIFSWAVIADSEPNSNGRQYSPEALASMAQQCRGRLVGIADGSGVLHLWDAWGIVVDSSVADGRLTVKIGWMQKQVPPVGRYITPVGRCSLATTPAGAAQIIGGDYQLEHLQISPTSFRSATQITYN